MDFDVLVSSDLEIVLSPLSRMFMNNVFLMCFMNTFRFQPQMCQGLIEKFLYASGSNNEANVIIK